MKTLKIKRLGKLAALFIVSALLFTSCGGDDGNSLSGGIYDASSSYTALVADEVAQLAAQLPCSSGATRFRVDFNTQNLSYQNTSTILGQFQTGSMSGTLSDSFLGQSGFGDILVATKVISGTQVIGYNISIHFCSANNIYTGEEILGPNVQISNFVTDNRGIVLDSNTSCSSGNVDYALTWVQSSGSQYPIETAFRPYCQ